MIHNTYITDCRRLDIISITCLFVQSAQKYSLQQILMAIFVENSRSSIFPPTGNLFLLFVGKKKIMISPVFYYVGLYSFVIIIIIFFGF